MKRLFVNSRSDGGCWNLIFGSRERRKKENGH